MESHAMNAHSHICGNKVPVGRTVVVGITHVEVALMSMEYGATFQDCEVCNVS